MKEKILNLFKVVGDRLVQFYWDHPTLATFVTGVVFGLLLAFIF